MKKEKPMVKSNYSQTIKVFHDTGTFFFNNIFMY